MNDATNQPKLITYLSGIKSEKENEEWTIQHKGRTALVTE